MISAKTMWALVLCLAAAATVQAEPRWSAARANEWYRAS
jgi:hypothetical protein